MVDGKKVVVVVLDALGVDTLRNYMDWTDKTPKLDFLRSMGLYHLIKDDIEIFSGNSVVAKVKQASATASSVMGHREMVGINDQTNYKLFVNEFPESYLDNLARILMGKGLRNPLREDGKIDFIFNKISGGEEAIELNYQEHEMTGFPIVYSSMCDPLIQIAVNRNIYAKDSSDLIAEVAFELADGHELFMERAISRPYENKDGKRIRIDGERHDVTLPLKQRTLVDILADKRVYTCGIGKIPDLIPGRWSEEINAIDVKFIDDIFRSHLEIAGKGSNAACLQGLSTSLNKGEGLYFVNLVDTDSHYGHKCKTKREDGKLVCEGALDELSRIDIALKYIFNQTTMHRGDVLVVTADHGIHWNENKNYGYHSLESLPLLAIHKEDLSLKLTLMSRKTLASVGYIVANEFDCGEEFKLMCRERNLIA